MANLTGQREAAGILINEAPKSPWGSGGSGGSGGGGSGGGDGGGPRNPWSFPPEGRRPRPGSGGTLDELLKRARRGGGGLPGGGSGFPTGTRLWLLMVGALLVIWVLYTSIHPIGPKE